MADRKSDKKSRGPADAQNGHLSVADPGCALADATARVSDQSGLLVGEDSHHATTEDAAHWIAVYTELLAFKSELLAITGRRLASMSVDARGEAADDHVVLTAQADKYTRRLGEWRAQVASTTATPSPSVLASL